MKIGNLEVYGVIYVIRNKRNNKLYIGQTTRESGFDERYCFKGNGIERVYNYHKYNRDKGCYYNKHLLNSIEKYGLEMFDVDECFDIGYSEIELNKLEDLYIKTFKTNNSKYGYNRKFGGGNGKHGENCRTRDGVIVYCLNDGKSFKSKRAAEQHYGLPDNYVTRVLKDKKFNKDVNNYQYFRFVQPKRELQEYEKLCSCCGTIIKLKKIKKSSTGKHTYNKSKKYCKKCAEIMNKARQGIYPSKKDCVIKKPIEYKKAS